MNDQAKSSGIQFAKEIAFKPGMPGTRRQYSAWHGLVIHWTGGERGAKDVCKTMRERETSVHFIVETDGRLVQTAELTTRCSHAGPANGRFLGVEVVSRGYATPADVAIAKMNNPDLRAREKIDWEVKRDFYQDHIGGRPVNMVSFNPEQIKTLVWLAEYLAKEFNFPRRIPSVAIREPNIHGFARLPLDNPADYLVRHEGLNWLPAFDRDETWRPYYFRGVIPHFGVHPTKDDCGTDILWKLWELGWNPAGALLA